MRSWPELTGFHALVPKWLPAIPGGAPVVQVHDCGAVGELQELPNGSLHCRPARTPCAVTVSSHADMHKCLHRCFGVAAEPAFHPSSVWLGLQSCACLRPQENPSQRCPPRSMHAHSLFVNRSTLAQQHVSSMALVGQLAEAHIITHTSGCSSCDAAPCWYQLHFE